jgi:S-adenosylmethionine/arginine decarboxylase-like enzyme
MNAIDSAFSLKYSDPWSRLNSMQELASLIWLLHLKLENKREGASNPIMTERDVEIEGVEPGFSGISLGTTSHIIAHSYSNNKYFRVDIVYSEDTGISQEMIIHYLQDILPEECKLLELYEPNPDEVA